MDIYIYKEYNDGMVYGEEYIQCYKDKSHAINELINYSPLK